MPTDKTQLVETTMLRGLVAGMALVILLLGAAGVVAVRGTRAIEVDTAGVGQEQLVMARLLNDAQAGQNMLAGVLHRLTRTPERTASEELLRDLEAADAALDRVAEFAAGAPEASQWKDLHLAEQTFSRGVRDSIRQGAPAGSLTQLFTAHDNVVRLEQELLVSAERRVAETEARIEEESRQLASQSTFLLGACVLLALVCAVLTVIFARKSIRNIEWHANELGRVSWHMLQTQEETARRFSHELHDELGQALAAIRANLTATDVGEWERRRKDSVEVVDGAIANVRELSQLLRPVILDDFGLDAGLRWLAERFAQRTNIGVKYSSSFDGRLPDAVETHLFRIAQEAFTNVARHSKATRVALDLSAAKGIITLTVEDDGRGIQAARSQDQAPAPSLGMTSMRARARHAGGEFRSGKSAYGGLLIEVQVPVGSLQEAHAG